MNSMLHDLGILSLRIWFGGTMLLAHGWPKLANFSSYAERFPDPIGLGQNVSLGLAVFAEVFCALLVLLGVLTRLASLPLIATMLVAFFVIHSADSFSDKELAFMYLGGFIVLALTGGGRFALLKSRLLPLS
jgi:putative oxidoreductase